MSENIAAFFSEFGQYSLTKYKTNTKYKSVLDALILTKGTYLNKNDTESAISNKILTECAFLDDNKIKQKIKSKIQLKLLNTKKSNEDIYREIMEIIDEIKIKDYLTHDSANE